MGDIAVLVAGAGPVGLTAAIELRRRGVACRIVDQLLEPPQYAKAVGVQPRTLEMFESMGVLRQVLDEAIEFRRGQIVYVDGQEVGRLELRYCRTSRSNSSDPAVRDRADPRGNSWPGSAPDRARRPSWSASSRTTTA